MPEGSHTHGIIQAAETCRMPKNGSGTHANQSIGPFQASNDCRTRAKRLARSAAGYEVGDTDGTQVGVCRFV